MKDAPDTPRSLRIRAETLSDLGRHAEALAVLAQALAQAPDEAQTSFRMAFELTMLRRDDEALEAVERGLRSEATRSWGHRLRSEILERMHRLDESLASALEGVKHAPEAVEPRLRLAQIYLRHGRYADALEVAGKAVQLAPDDTRAWRKRGCAAYYLDNWKLARECCERAVALAPSNRFSLDDLGMVLRGEAKVDVLRRAYALDPTKGWALVDLADALAGVGRTEEARSAAESAVRMAPRDAVVLARASRVLAATRGWARAAELAEGVLALDPDQGVAWQTLALVRLERGDAAAALSAFEERVRRGPAGDPFGLVDVVRTLSRLERHGEALAIARQHVARCPTQLRSWRSLAAVAAAVGEAATVQLPVLTGPDWGEPYSHEAEGHLARGRGDWAAAEACYRMALAVDPDLCCALTGLSLVKLHVGEAKAARELRERARVGMPCNCWAGKKADEVLGLE